MIPALLLGITAALDPAPALSGNCSPTRVHFTGHITADGPADVTYTWVRLGRPPGTALRVHLDKAGTVPVSYDVMVRKNEEGSVMLRVVLPTQTESAKVKYQVNCK